MKREVFDILIIGGGVAGMTAAIYAKRRNKKVAIIEPFLLGGQLAQIEKIENFDFEKQDNTHKIIALCWVTILWIMFFFSASAQICSITAATVSDKTAFFSLFFTDCI